MSRWRELAGRPVSTTPRDSRRVLVAVGAVFLVLAALTITLYDASSSDEPPTATRTQTRQARPAPAAPAPAAPAAPIEGIEGETVSGVPSPELETAARTFFGTYLRYLYGRGGTIRSASGRLSRSLRRQGPLSSLRQLDPRVTEVRAANETRSTATVTVTVDDGRDDGTTQPIAARFRVVDGEWVATALEGMS